MESKECCLHEWVYDQDLSRKICRKCLKLDEAMFPRISEFDEIYLKKKEIEGRQ